MKLLKKFKITYFFIFLITTSVNGQWLTQTNSIGGTSVFFTDENTGWVLNDNAIYKTSNSGNSWNLQNSNTQSSLNSLYFTNSMNGWAVGKEGTILKTTDGGTNWFNVSGVTSKELNRVFFVNDALGFIVGVDGLILKTTNAGGNWVIKSSGTISNLHSVRFISNLTGWVVGRDKTILKTTNGGENWIQQSANVGDVYRDIYFVSSNIGFIVGGWSATGYILKTTNGGINWTSQTVDNSFFYSIQFVNQSTGWLCGFNNKILKTTNQGVTWIDQDIVSAGVYLWGLHFPSENVGWCITAPDPVGSWGNESILKYLSPTPSNYCSNFPFIIYGEKLYSTVSIGNQCWLKENLDIGIMVEGNSHQYNNGILEKYCYDNNPANCNTHGGLYQWDEAMQYSTVAGAKGICPDGWHIPRLAEFTTLKAAVNNDGNALKAVGQGGGNGAGTNTSGFSALLGGERINSGGSGGLGIYTYFWSSTQVDLSYANTMYLYNDNSNISLHSSYLKIYGYSVRCIKDETQTSTIQLNIPNGGETWQVGSSQNITWTSSNVTNVKLEYTTNNGVGWTSIIASTAASSGSYAWTIPNTPSTQCKVRISDVSNSAVGDTSNKFFAIGSVPINPCPGTPTVTYAGKTYNTVQIGDQCWLRENLNVGTMILGTQNATNNGTIEKYCFDNDTINCNIYGGLYQWDEAMQYSTVAGAKGICPDGWHVPILTEFQTLASSVGNNGIALKAVGQGTSGGAGTNTSGFSVLLGGYRNNNNNFELLNMNAFHWSSTEHIQNYSHNFALGSGDNGIPLNVNNRELGFNIRCIRGVYTLQINTPNGGENWQVGSTQNITWTSSNVTNVKLEYTTNNGTNWTSIIASTPASTGSYAWTIPNTPSTQCKVRISDASNSAVGDTSNKFFAIGSIPINPCPGTPTVTYEGKTYNTVQIGDQCWLRENLNVGQRISGSQNQTNNSVIEKYCYGNDTINCNIYGGLYQWNEAMQYSTLAGAKGICPDGWHLPTYAEFQTMSNAVSNDGNALKAVGQGTGTGAGNDLTGFSALFSGRRNSSSNDYSALGDRGYFWSSTENDINTYLLTLSTYNSNINFYNEVKTYAYSIRCIKDMSTIQLNTPNGGENWQVGSSQNITWTSSNVTNVKLEYTTNNGSSWSNIIASTPASTESYAWTIPNTPSTQCKVRVSDVSNSAVGDTSNKFFAIGSVPINPCPGTPTVTYAGKTYNTVQIGDQCWLRENLDVGVYVPSTNTGISHSDLSNNSIIEKYCYDNDTLNCNIYGGMYTWDEAMQYVNSQGAQGICPPGWHIPSNAEFQLLISNSGNSSNALKELGQGISGGVGTNTTGFSALLSGYRLSSGAFDNFNGNGGFWSSIEEPNSMARVLVINNSDNDFQNGTLFWNYGVSVRCIQDAILPPTLQLNNPNGGENWQVGSTQNITWTSSNVTNVKLEYTTNNGSSWSNIIASTPASTGSYAWTIPNTPSTQCKVRVSDISNSAISDMRDNFFAITSVPINPCPGTPTVTYGGKTYNTVQIGDQCWLRENLDVGTMVLGTQNQTNNSVIEKYCYDNDTVNCNIYGGLYQWNVAMQYSTVAGAKGICPDGWHIPTHMEFQTLASEVGNNSNFLKEIGQGLGNGAGTNSSGFSVLLSGLNNDSGFLNLGYSSYFWSSTEYNASSAYYRNLRSDDSNISLGNDPKTYGFSIRCIKNESQLQSLQLNSPNGGETWQVGSSQNITWTSSNVTNVKLEYTTNNGTNWTSIIASTPASTGSYAWTIPNTPSTQCKVRISDTSNSAVGDTSNKLFAITSVPINPCPGTPTVTYEGKTYNTVQIGDQCWLRENLDVGSMILGTQNATNNGTIEKYCYDNDTINCNIYGGLYQWDEAMQYSTVAGAKGICPDGWHIPTYEEYLALRSQVSNSGNALKAIGQGISPGMGTNTSGFSGLISSYRKTDGTFQVFGENTNFWSSSYFDTSNRKYLGLDHNSNGINLIHDLSSMGNNIRCVKDEIQSINLQLNSPNGGENLTIGTVDTIKWSASNVTNVKLEYTTNNGNSWLNISSSISASLGRYAWTIPNTPSTQCKVRISDVNNSSVGDTSSGLFNIVVPLPAQVELVEPQNNIVGVVQPVTFKWKSALWGTSYRIEIATDGLFVSKVYIDSTITDTVKVIDGLSSLTKFYWRIAAKNSGGMGQYSTIRNFQTLGVPTTVTLIYPSNNQTNLPLSVQFLWTKGIDQQFRNSSEAGGSEDESDVGVLSPTTVTKYWFELVRDTVSMTGLTLDTALVDTTKLVSGLLNKTNYYWRVKSKNEAGWSGFTYWNKFSTNVDVLLTKPNGGETWIVGTTDTIKWTSTNIANVKLEYTTNNGTNWLMVSTSTSATSGSHVWTIPNTPSAQCRVRITDVNNSTVKDSSDNTFTIQVPVNPVITVVQPNGGEDWYVGSSRNITWISNDVSNVRVEYTTNNGSNWLNIITSTSASAQSFPWTVPNTPSTQCKVRIINVSNSAIGDTSNGLFTISAAPALQLLKPNGGENWVHTSTDTIKWTSVNVTNVKLEYTTNNGTDWLNIISSTPASSGSYTWVIPNTPSTQCRVKISDVSNSAIKDSSDNTFTIIRPTISILSPNGGENWPAGYTKAIQWTSANLPIGQQLILQYSTNNGANWLSVNTTFTPTSQYIWQVPNTPSTQCKVRVYVSGSPAIEAISSNVFTISETPSIALTKPNGGQNWVVGSVDTIQWTSSNISDVKLEYTTNNGGNWIAIINNLTNTGSYLWDIPNTPSTLCLVRVSDASNSATNDISDANFTISLPIVKEITVLSPNGGENWYIGDTETITWTSSNVGNVKLEYSTNSGTNWSNIISSVVATSGSYNWTVPNTPSVNCKVRVTDVTNSTIGDSSNNQFTISVKPSLTLLTPNGGESWLANSVQTITWNSTFNSRGSSKNVGDSEEDDSGDIDEGFTSNNPLSISKVKLQYTTTNGTLWITISDSTDNDGSYDWTVPNTPSNSCRVKISDTNISSTKDSSDNVFSITSPPEQYILITSPNGGESWDVGSPKNVTWTSSNVNNVKIQYTTNAGTEWVTITENTLASFGSYGWPIPNAVSTQCLVRIYSVANNSIGDTSDNFFTIKAVVNPQITVTAPNGGEVWDVAVTNEIRWTSQDIANVRIEYTTNNGTNWLQIVSSISAQAGSYNWMIPNSPSTQCKVRILDVNNLLIGDSSNALFTIRLSQSVTLISPNGGEMLRYGDIHQIKWVSQNVTNIKLEYSTNGGSNWLLIANSILASQNEFDWTVPNHSFTQASVKISSVENPSISDVSNGAFLIINPSITLLSPNGGENYRIGRVAQIEWTSSDIDNVKLEYSTNNGTNWNVIISQVSASLGNYSWTVPGTAIAQCKIRISDVSNQSINDISDEFFSIVAPAISLLTPNGGEELVGTSVITISWNLSYVDTVNVDLSSDGGTTWTSLYQNLLKTQTSTSWIVPQNINSTQCRIKVSEKSNSALFDISDANFSIINYPPTVNTKSYSVTFPDANKQSSFRMVGVPGQSTSINLSAIMGGAHKTDWNAYFDNGAAANYFVEYDGSSTFNFAPGKGFWVISKNTINSDLNLSMPQLSGEGYYAVPLHNGWNIISNPFDITVPWDAVKQINNITAAGEVIHGWTGQWGIASEMKVFEGYYYKNDNNRTSLRIPYKRTSNMAKINLTSANYFPNSDLIEISLFNNEKLLTPLVAGFNELALEKFDDYDIYAPPGDFEEAGLRFVNNNIDNWKELFVDHRPYNAEGQSFEVNYKNTTDEDLTVVVKYDEKLSDNEIYLVDERIAKFYNIKENNKLRFSSYIKKANLKLLVGKEGFIQSERTKLQPNEYMLFQNYPNPFNPKTVIRYSIPYNNGTTEVNVSLKIYDIVGREIVTLVEGMQSGGYHEIEFDATKLATGIYLYSLSAGEFKSVKKMILMK